jgi:hypothetical protein
MRQVRSGGSATLVLMAAFLLLLVAYNKWGTHIVGGATATQKRAAQACHFDIAREGAWQAVAAAAGTDKVAHHYYAIYDEFLPGLRHRAVNFLEIGLGCDMSYGPGASLDLWTKYFSHRKVRIAFLEFDAACVAKMAPSGVYRHNKRDVRIFAGDQSTDLPRVGKALGRLDVVVDDGGHTWQQQVGSASIIKRISLVVFGRTHAHILRSRHNHIFTFCLLFYRRKRLNGH